MVRNNWLGSWQFDFDGFNGMPQLTWHQIDWDNMD
jgi:hypothetical protein